MRSNAGAAQVLRRREKFLVRIIVMGGRYRAASGPSQPGAINEEWAGFATHSSNQACALPYISTGLRLFM